MCPHEWLFLPLLTHTHNVLNRFLPVSLPYRNGGNDTASQYLYVCLKKSKNMQHIEVEL